MIPSMYAKLFSRIAQSSLMEEDVEVRYCFMMMLAIADSGGDVIGTDVAIARTINLPLDTFRRCADALSQPDPDSNSQAHDGRRLIPSDAGRGYLIVNYTTYRAIKTADEKKAYMREYMKRYRKSKNDNDVTHVKQCKDSLTLLGHAEGEGEAEEEPPKAPTAGKPPEGEKKPKTGRIPTTPHALRIAALFHRRPTTPWSEKEYTAFRRIAAISDEDMDAIERYYAAERAKGDDGRHRRDLKTFLNNFNGELDRARMPDAAPRKPDPLSGYRMV